MKSFNFVLLMMAFLLASPVVYASLQSKNQYVSVVQAPDISAITVYNNQPAQYKPLDLAVAYTSENTQSIVFAQAASSAVVSQNFSSQVPKPPEVVATLETKTSSSSSSLVLKMQDISGSKPTLVAPLINISSSVRSVDSVVPTSSIIPIVEASIAQKPEVLVSSSSVSSSSSSSIITISSEINPSYSIDGIAKQPQQVASSSSSVVVPVPQAQEQKPDPIVVAKPAPVEEAPKAEVKDSNYSGDTYHQKIDFYCVKYGCNPIQLKRVMNCESTNNPMARNGKYFGLFQFGVPTFYSFASRAGVEGADIYNPEHQIAVASWGFANGMASHWSCK